jgi:hypothetical protein
VRIFECAREEKSKRTTSMDESKKDDERDAMSAFVLRRAR